jgi:hypothetical protein
MQIIKSVQDTQDTMNPSGDEAMPLKHAVNKVRKLCILLHARGKIPHYPLGRRLGEPQSRIEPGSEEKNPCHEEYRSPKSSHCND